jgi:hypothetical protein
MGTVERIRKYGYRKWYERQLVESHLYLVTLVLALVMVVAGLELLSAPESRFELLYNGLLVAGGGWLSWVCLQRYARMMMLAEHVGSQAVCPSCQRNGFQPVPPEEAGVHGRPLQFVASCRGCGTRWSIDAGD